MLNVKNIKKKGSTVEKVIKEILNTCYGKTIQKAVKESIKFINNDNIDRYLEKNAVFIKSAEEFNEKNIK